VECYKSWHFIGRHFQRYDTSPMILNWPWAWPSWNCTTSYKFSVSVKKMGEGWTGGTSDMVKTESSGKDPRATGGFVSNLLHPRVNKTKQHWWLIHLKACFVFMSLPYFWHKWPISITKSLFEQWSLRECMWYCCIGSAYVHIHVFTEHVSIWSCTNLAIIK